MFTHSVPFLLSRQGSDRATAYDFANKAVTRNGKTHVVWTDAVALTRGRTFDHAAGEWGDTITIGEGRDNHNNPSLTADAEGRLRIAYGPHGIWDQLQEPEKWPSGSFKYSRASGPDTLAAFESVRPVGYCATYACLLNTPDGRDAMVYRGGEEPYAVLFQIQRPQGGWTQARALFAQAIKPQYTFYGASLTAGPGGDLFVAAHFYSLETSRSEGVGVLRSPDNGATWLDLKGRRIALPALYGPRVAVPSFPAEHSPYNGGVVATPDGALWALAHASQGSRYPLRLSRWDGRGWDTINLDDALPPERGACRAHLSLDGAGCLHILAAAVDKTRLAKGADPFGHPSLQIFHLGSNADKTTFQQRLVSDGDPEIPSWNPSLSLPGPFHPVEKPVLLFTKGLNQPAGEHGCRHTWKAEVYCVLS